MNRYHLIVLTLCLSALCSPLATAGAPQGNASLPSQIDTLISAVASSDCTFIRNGKQHTARESVKHISRKYAHFEDEIDSIESFVTLTASKSLMTGRAYQVQCGASSMASQDWMLNKAEELGLPLGAGDS